MAAGSGRQRELGLRGVRGVRAMLGHTAQRGLGPGGVGERQGRVFSVRPSDRPSILPSSQLTPRSICSVPGVGDIKVNGAGKVPILIMQLLGRSESVPFIGSFQIGCRTPPLPFIT